MWRTVPFVDGRTVQIPSPSRVVTNRGDLEAFFERIRDIHPCAMLDIGANKGYYALLATLKPDLRFSCYEPIESVYKRFLRPNILQNGVAAMGRTFNFGFSNRSGTFDLWYDNTENATLAKDVQREREIAATLTKYPGRAGFLRYRQTRARFQRLDDWLACMTMPRLFGPTVTSSRIDVVKLDVEGAEGWVLDGGREFFAGQRPLLFVEIEERHCERFSTTVAERLDHLRKLGYRTMTPIGTNFFCSA